MSATSLLEEITPALARRGLGEIEVFVKEGRSRRFEIGPQGRIALHSHERGWAVRAGGDRASLFVAGSGRLDPAQAWPEPDGGPIQLPAPAPVASWTRPADFDAPLIVESEAIAFLESVDRQLRSELPGARLLRGFLEEGSSEARLANSRGVHGVIHRRSAALFLEAARTERGRGHALSYLAERAARGFSPSALARRLADRVQLQEAGGSPQRDRGELLLAPPVVAAVLAGLLPMLVGPEAEGLCRRFRDRGGRIGSRWLTLIDDGRHPGGVLEAPIDGEGVETRRNLLVEEGVFHQPLLSWREARPGQRWSGCCVRPGWRDVPRPGPTHLYLRPDPSVSAASLLGAVTRGYYLLEAAGAGRFDFESDRLELPVRGYALRRGRSVGSFCSARLSGAISAWLRGVQAVARDLSFLPLDGLLGGPTILVTGIELDSA